MKKDTSHDNEWILATFVSTDSNTHFKTLLIHFLCTCSLEAETTNHVILHCPYYENEDHNPLVSIRSVKSIVLDQIDNNIVKTLLYGLDSLSETQNTSILNDTMELLISCNRFEEQLY